MLPTVLRTVSHDSHQNLLVQPRVSLPPTQAKPARPGKPCKSHKEAAQAEAKSRGIKLLVKDIINKFGCKDCTPPRPAEPSRLYTNQRAEDETPAEETEPVEINPSDNAETESENHATSQEAAQIQ